MVTRRAPFRRATSLRAAPEERLRALQEQGFGLAMMEYRGSGATGGKSSEMNFARDALAFYDQLDELMVASLG